MKHNNPDNHANDSNNTPKKVAVSGKVSVEYDPRGISDVAKAIREEKTAAANEKDKNKQITDKQITQQTRGNTIAKAANWLTAAMVIATVAVFWQSRDAIRAANRSATFADSTFQEVKKEFKVENEPILQLDSFIIDTLKPNSAINFRYVIKNLGKYPVRVISAATMSATKVNTPDFEDVERQAKDGSIVNRYVVFGTPLDMNSPGDEPLPIGNFLALARGKAYLYYWGYIRYENLSNKGEKKEYKYMLRLNIPQKTQVLIINDNVPYLN